MGRTSSADRELMQDSEAAERMSLCRWWNYRAISADHQSSNEVAPVMQDLSKDAKSGVPLYKLVMVLTGGEPDPALATGGDFDENPKTTLERQLAALAALQAAGGVELANLDNAKKLALDGANAKQLRRMATDLCNGKLTTMVALTWAMVVRFEVCKRPRPGVQPSAAASAGLSELLEWLRLTAEDGGVSVGGGRSMWSSDVFNDGRIFGALLHSHSPEKFPADMVRPEYPWRRAPDVAV